MCGSYSRQINCQNAAGLSKLIARGARVYDDHAQTILQKNRTAILSHQLRVNGG
jgi:hypothetical protein